MRLHTGMLYGGSQIRIRDVPDGTSNTFFVGERGIPSSGEFGWWSGPGTASTCPLGWSDVVLSSGGGLGPPTGEFDDAMHWWSHHEGGAHFAMVDGSVRFLADAIDLMIFQGLSERADGKVLGEF